MFIYLLVAILLLWMNHLLMHWAILGCIRLDGTNLNPSTSPLCLQSSGLLSQHDGLRGRSLWQSVWVIMNNTNYINDLLSRKLWTKEYDHVNVEGEIVYTKYLPSINADYIRGLKCLPSSAD